MVGYYDRTGEVKAFDEMKIGVKGLIDSGIKQIPRIFHHPHHATVTNPKPSPSTLKIPTIDLGGGVFESTTVVTRESVIAEVRDAVVKFGFFQVINHGIPVDVMEKMKDGIRGFHEQDLEVKKTFYSRDITKKVYSQAANWRDTLTTVMAPDVPQVEDLPAICREIMLEYSKRMMKLGELIFELLSEALGLKPNHLKELGCAKSLSLLSHYYPPCPEPDRTFGISSHTDISFITILLQDKIGGLQVLHDGYWIDVPPNPEALIVNLGDLLQLITNDKFVSVEHRVLANRGEEPRISTASFFMHTIPNEQRYGPIKELLSEQNPPKYRDTTTTEMARHYLARGLDGTSPLLHFRI
ncbi:hypothetical protein CARUB_v10025512mg [Capsella rubella]|uniref:Fe2OG dioxygenase domain-containing protein n=1 Tax=Capsella rubella TaxID=81985 RepID=R0HYR5_9BRAS|nr:hypothetical protein CARUB_v10025512mg [Capsella rubella]